MAGNIVKMFEGQKEDIVDEEQKKGKLDKAQKRLAKEGYVNLFRRKAPTHGDPGEFVLPGGSQTNFYETEEGPIKIADITNFLGSDLLETMQREHIGIGRPIGSIDANRKPNPTLEEFIKKHPEIAKQYLYKYISKDTRDSLFATISSPTENNKG